MNESDIEKWLVIHFQQHSICSYKHSIDIQQVRMYTENQLYVCIGDFHCVLSRLCNLQEIAILVHKLLLSGTWWESESEELEGETTIAV